MVAFAGSGFLPDGLHPSCCQWQEEVVVQDRVAGFGSVRPIADPVERPARQVVDTPEDVRLVALDRRPGSEDR